MVKGTTRRLQKHQPKPSQRKIVTSSNTSTRLRKVVTFHDDVVTPASTSTQEEDVTLPDFGESETTPNQVDCPAGINIRTTARRYQNSDAPLLTWRQFRQDYLDSCLKLDGRGSYTDQCAGCQYRDPTFRCHDCSGSALYCNHCIVQQHCDRPLHVIEEWKNHFFHKVTLQSLGLRVQLGHQMGTLCPFCTRGHKDFVVLHLNGVHVINLDFCGCPGALPFRNQLLEMGWWPSTPLEPQSAATMDVLRSFHIWNLQGHIAPTDFYRGLEQITCGDGLVSLPDRLAQWMLMVRQWRHIKMTKRAGRGHDPSGIIGTPLGGLSIPCRPCPHPNINLPIGWEDAPDEIKWIYGLILAEDANFKQKARLRSNNMKDPPLGPGWATFVHNDAYLEHLAKYIDQDEISHCVGFAALWNANNKRSKGLRATGIGSVSCARHEMYRVNGMGDLQKGERYANMDYIFLSSIMGTMLFLITISYDIACQWGANFTTRMNAMPSSLQMSVWTTILFLVPKFHLPAHVTKCHAPFSFNYARGVGRTDGEGVERNWSILNKIAPSVSMMGPGGRWDTIDDFCNYSNWRKTINLAATLLRKMSIAIPQAVIHHRALSAFTETLQIEHADHVVEWELQVQSWELDHSLPCPYNLPDQKITFAEVKRQLSEEEHKKVEKGEALLNLDNLSPSAFLVMALEIEEAQQVLRVDIKVSQTTTQQTAIQRRRTNLLKRIQKFTEVQSKYMPGLTAYLETLAQDPNELATSTPELIPLYLPSALPSDIRPIVCIADIEKIEDRLRFAQASEALTRLRCQLTKRAYANRYKVRNVSSQRHYTRFRALQDHTESKVKAAHLQYTTARTALLKLRGPGTWEDNLRHLRPEDVRGLNEQAIVEEERQEDRRARNLAGLSDEPVLGELDGIEDLPATTATPHLAVGEGHRTLSWIWYSTTGEEFDSNAFAEACLRVEWVKSRARAARWKEEVQMLEEEMRRSIQFCAWKAKWWEDQACRRTDISAPLAEGITAYAAAHASAERRRLIVWSHKWAAIRQRASVVLEGHLMNKEDQVDLTHLDIEIEDEDEDEEGIVDEAI